jgi:hypothetical protein
MVLRSHAGRLFEDKNRKFLRKGNSGMPAKPIRGFLEDPNTSKGGKAREDDQRH